MFLPFMVFRMSAWKRWFVMFHVEYSPMFVVTTPGGKFMNFSFVIFMCNAVNVTSCILCTHWWIHHTSLQHTMSSAKRLFGARTECLLTTNEPTSVLSALWRHSHRGPINFNPLAPWNLVICLAVKELTDKTYVYFEVNYRPYHVPTIHYVFYL
jgi:hypothetical protein